MPLIGQRATTLRPPRHPGDLSVHANFLTCTIDHARLTNGTLRTCTPASVGNPRPVGRQAPVWQAGVKYWPTQTVIKSLMLSIGGSDLIKNLSWRVGADDTDH